MGGGQCSQIEQVIPSSLSLPSTASHLTLLISALPKLPPRSDPSGGYICVYGQNVTAVRAKTVARGKSYFLIGKKMGLTQKYAFNKKSTIFIQ